MSNQKSQIKQMFLWFVIIGIAIACTSDLNVLPAQEVSIVSPSSMPPNAPTLSIPDMEPTEIAPTPTLASPAPQTDAAGYPVPSPVSPTNTPMPDGTVCFVNRIAGFTLQIPSSWHVSGPWDTAFPNVFRNYAPPLAGGDIMNLLPGELKMDMMVYPLEEGQSFDQWVEERRNSLASSQNPGVTPIQLTEPTPITIGSYNGVSYTSVGAEDFLIIKLSNDDKAISISFSYAGSSAQTEALDILSTLDASGNETCN